MEGEVSHLKFALQTKTRETDYHECKIDRFSGATGTCVFYDETIAFLPRFAKIANGGPKTVVFSKIEFYLKGFYNGGKSETTAAPPGDTTVDLMPWKV